MLDIAALGGALSTIETIADLLKNANDAQLALRITPEIIALQGQLLDVQQQALALQVENNRLQSELNKARSYVQHHSVIWRKREDGSEDEPFCPICLGEQREMRLLRQHVDQSGDYWFLQCGKQHVQKGSELEP